MAGRLIAAVGLMLACGVALPASAGPHEPTRACYHDIGCPWDVEVRQETFRSMSCERLAHIRNRLLHEKGYCFHVREPREEFGNAGCKYQYLPKVPLNRVERANVDKIRRAERDKGCHTGIIERRG